MLHAGDYDPRVTVEDREHEREADLFAAHFLMPMASFQKEWAQSSGLGLYDRVLKLKRIYRVSYLTVLYRLDEMGAPGCLGPVQGRGKAAHGSTAAQGR